MCSFKDVGLPLLVAVFAVVYLSSVPRTKIKTKLGEINGFEEETVGGKLYYSFLGVPYAVPPIDSLRFKDPVPSKQWEGVLDGSKMPEYCIQKSAVQESLGNNPFIGSEDCLYLNIYVPKGKQNLPVMVYLHGGAFYRGAASEYGAATLLNDDVILVIPQYRLGIFGFLSTEDSNITGNFGLKDQNLALKWVKENIESFGGNPNMVTLFGQSAGGAALHYHLLSPSSKGLFNRAILQSGTALCPWAQSSHHREFAIMLGKKFGCSVDSPTYVTCLQQVDALLMLKYAASLTKFYISPNYFTPRTDGVFIPKSVEESMSNQLPEIDIIAGVVKNEGAAALGSFNVLETDFKNLLPTSLVVEREENSANLALQIFEKYFGVRQLSSETKDEFVEMMGDRYFHICHQIFCQFYSKRQNSKLFLYEFNYKPESSFFDSSYKRWIPHAEDLGLLFNGVGIFSHNLTNPEDLRMRTMLSKLWTNFAIHGHPTPDDSMGFVWEMSSPNMNHLNISSAPQMENNQRKKIVKFWKSLPLKQNAAIYGQN